MTRYRLRDFVFEPGAIPQELRRLPLWAPWKGEDNPARGKMDKIPMSRSNPTLPISTRQLALWGEFDKALAAVNRHSDLLCGVGLCMTDIYKLPEPVMSFDLDGAIENGEVKEWAQEIVTVCASYAEISPSDRGIRIMMLGTFECDWANHDVGVEFYSGHAPRFLTMTGNRLHGAPAELRAVSAETIAAFRDRYAPRRETAEVIDISAQPPELDPICFTPWEELPLSAAAMQFLREGSSGDRSADLQMVTTALYETGLTDAEVFSTLLHNPHAMGVALSHRRYDHDRALTYLWVHHCSKAKNKVANRVATPGEFDVLPPVEVDGTHARPHYRRAKSGAIQSKVLPNLIMALADPLEVGARIYWDEFKAVTLIARDKQWGRPIQDRDLTEMREHLERNGFEPIPKRLFAEAVELVAHRNKIDSAIEWASSLQWDGTPRIDNYLHRYYRTPDSPYTRAVSAYMWTALAGRCLDPGCQVDMMPIFVGPQGLIKSNSIKAMVPDDDLFCELNFHRREDDLTRVMRGALVAEVAELQGLHTRDLESIKAFITRRTEKWVPKYVEHPMQFKRRLLLIGTSNEEEFLADITGNRRFLPIRVGDVDVEGIRRDRDQLWAEGIVRWSLAGVEWRAAEQLAPAEHADFTIGDLWEEFIQEWLQYKTTSGERWADLNVIPSHDILTECFNMTSNQINAQVERRLARAMAALGYKRVRVRTSRGQLRGYKRK